MRGDAYLFMETIRVGEGQELYETSTKSCGITVWAESLKDALAAGRSLGVESQFGG